MLEIKISDKVEEPLLSRSAFRGLISFDAATPSRAEVRKKVAEALNADFSVVSITAISTRFGSKSAAIAAHVYKTKEDLEKFELKAVINRHKGKDEKAAEAKDSAEGQKEAAKPGKKHPEAKDEAGQRPQGKPKGADSSAQPKAGRDE
ncbi:hypothetical protein HYX10_04020 [Candidatus Woesearchaeota archaeon]|nr:hypothetical protein [Candidatus Woesearchaeota archaeon]